MERTKKSSQNYKRFFKERKAKKMEIKQVNIRMPDELLNRLQEHLDRINEDKPFKTCQSEIVCQALEAFLNGK